MSAADSFPETTEEAATDMAAEEAAISQRFTIHPAGIQLEAEAAIFKTSLADEPDQAAWLFSGPVHKRPTTERHMLLSAGSE